jgi:metal-sulfur cluster biosynthetic enzyme
MSEESNPLSEEELARIMDALREVYDPEIPINVVDLGLIRKIEEMEGDVNITVILTAPGCPLASMIVEMARRAVQAVTERVVRVTLSSERWDPSMMADSGRQRLGL